MTSFRVLPEFTSYVKVKVVRYSPSFVLNTTDWAKYIYHFLFVWSLKNKSWECYLCLIEFSRWIGYLSSFRVSFPSPSHLLIRFVKIQDGGHYQCLATNPAGYHSNGVSIRVRGKQWCRLFWSFMVIIFSHFQSCTEILNVLIILFWIVFIKWVQIPGGNYCKVCWTYSDIWTINTHRYLFTFYLNLFVMYCLSTVVTMRIFFSSQVPLFLPPWMMWLRSPWHLFCCYGHQPSKTQLLWLQPMSSNTSSSMHNKVPMMPLWWDKKLVYLVKI